MLRDRHEPLDLFALVPKLGRELDPILTQLDQLLDDDVVFQKVKTDLARRYPRTLTSGRHSTPVEVILRMLVMKRFYHWSYAETEHFVADRLVVRQFCRVSREAVPDDTTLIRWANRIGPQTIAQVNDRVVELARVLKVTRGRKLRAQRAPDDGGGDEHSGCPLGPTDSRILGDGVRVLSRLLRRAKDIVTDGKDLPKTVFRSHTRSVRRGVPSGPQEIHRGPEGTPRRKGEEAAESLQRGPEGTPAKLIGIAEASKAQAEHVRDYLAEQADHQAKHLVQQFAHFLPLVDQAIAQATRRVIVGEVVPALEKLLSLFEPHTQLIVRHKPGKPTEFGRKVLLDEVEGGLISRYEVLADGGGQDAPYLRASLEGHRKRFGRAPDLLAGDRGVASPTNEKLARAFGVKRIILPRSGTLSEERRTLERARWFRRGFRFRAGIAGTVPPGEGGQRVEISVLKRCQGLDVCRNHGEEGFGRWVGWGIVTANLAKIAETLVGRAARRTKAA